MTLKILITENHHKNIIIDSDTAIIVVGEMCEFATLNVNFKAKFCNYTINNIHHDETKEVKTLVGNRIVNMMDVRNIYSRVVVSEDSDEKYIELAKLYSCYCDNAIDREGV